MEIRSVKKSKWKWLVISWTPWVKNFCHCNKNSRSKKINNVHVGTKVRPSKSGIHGPEPCGINCLNQRYSSNNKLKCWYKILENRSGMGIWEKMRKLKILDWWKYFLRFSSSATVLGYFPPEKESVREIQLNLANLP